MERMFETLSVSATHVSGISEVHKQHINACVDVLFIEF